MKGRKASFVILTLLCAFLFWGSVKADDSANWGALQVDIRLEGKQLNNSAYIVKHDVYYPGATDGIDPPQGSTQYDVELLLFSSDRSGAFVDIENKKLDQEISANSSRTAKHIKGFYKGTIAPGSEPDIVVELSWNYAEPTEGRFGTMPLILTQEIPDGNNLEIGYRGDLRAEMANSGTPDFVSIPFGKIPAGTYTENGPYFLHLRLDFDKPLADLDNNYEVNLKDFAIVAKYWGYEGACLADITGTDGIPDLVVDNYDLAKFLEYWMQGVGG